MCCLKKESRGFKGQHGGKGVVVPLLTTDNIEKTHPWTSCDIWKYTDTGDRETDRGRNTQDQHLHRQTDRPKESNLYHRDKGTLQRRVVHVRADRTVIQSLTI